MRVKTKSSGRPKSLWLALVLGLAVVVAGLVLASNRSHQTTVTPTVTPGTAASPIASVKPGQSISPDSGSDSATPTPSTRPTSDTLAAPTGQLLSSSSVSLSKNDAEESVCQTVISATCTIVVVSPSGQSASFSAPATDSSGGHLIDWTPKQYAASVGTWQIYAEASLNGQTNSSPIYTFQVTQ